MHLFKGLKLTKEERKSRIRFHKGLKEKRKKYVKFFKEGGPWDSYYLYNPVKMIIQDMYEYYKNGDCVMGIPVITNKNGEIIQKDDREITLKTALELIEKAEDLDDTVDEIIDMNEARKAWDNAHKAYIDAYAYIADQMDRWGD